MTIADHGSNILGFISNLWVPEGRFREEKNLFLLSDLQKFFLAFSGEFSNV